MPTKTNLKEISLKNLSMTSYRRFSSDCLPFTQFASSPSPTLAHCHQIWHQQLSIRWSCEGDTQMVNPCTIPVYSISDTTILVEPVLQMVYFCTILVVTVRSRPQPHISFITKEKTRQNNFTHLTSPAVISHW